MCVVIRGILSVALQGVLLAIVVVTLDGPNIMYIVGLGFGEFSFSWEMTRETFFYWTEIDYIFHWIFLFMDLVVFGQLFDRPLRRNARLKAVVINGLRVFVTLFELAILSQNWTATLIKYYNLIGVNWMMRISVVFIELALFAQVGFIVSQLRALESVEF